MATSDDKFRKLLAAYEDEVQRKQHRMSKRIEPTDDPRPDPHGGICPFVRVTPHGTYQVVWTPSFDVIGTYDPASTSWLWGWAEAPLDPRVRTRMEQVRSQGDSWSMTTLTTPHLQLEGETPAWELASISVGILGADAMFRYIDPDGPSGEQHRFLALFDAPPPSRSASLRAVKGSGREVVVHATSGGHAYPAMSRYSQPQTARASQSGGLRTSSTGMPAQRLSSTGSSMGMPATRTSSMNMPAQRVSSVSSLPPIAQPGTSSSSSMRLRSLSSVPMPTAIVTGEEEEPTEATRQEFGKRLQRALPLAHQAQLGVLTLLAHPIPASGPVGSLAFHVDLVFRSLAGTETPIAAPPQLHEAVAALWYRCGPTETTSFRSMSARLELTSAGMSSTVTIDR